MLKIITFTTCITGLLFANLAFAADDNKPSLFQKTKRWTCKIEAQSLCSEKTCKESKPTAWIELNYKDNGVRYKRCDSKGCTPTVGSFIASDKYTVITLPYSGALLKVTNDGKTFIDFATKDETGLVGFGTCTPKEEESD